MAVAFCKNLNGVTVLEKKTLEHQLCCVTCEIVSDRGVSEPRRRSIGQSVGNLSGGNQQKVVLARWLALRPKVLIVDEPTRGIDVGAKVEVHNLLFEMAQAGIAIIVISSELPEILSLADRIITMREGRVTGEIMRADADQQKLMTLMTLGKIGQAA